MSEHMIKPIKNSNRYSDDIVRMAFEQVLFETDPEEVKKVFDHDSLRKYYHNHSQACGFLSYNLSRGDKLEILNKSRNLHLLEEIKQRYERL